MHALMGNAFFWVSVRVFHVCHSPLSHHLNFMQANHTKGHVAMLVCGKAKSILSEFERDLVNTNWEEMGKALGNPGAALFLAVSLALRLSASYIVGSLVT